MRRISNNEAKGIQKRWRMLVLALLCMCVAPQLSAAPPANAPEYAVKSLMIKQFTAFLEWPDSKLAKDQDLVVGVLGNSPLFDEKDQIDGQKVKTPPHTIAVRKVKTIEEARDCHIVFISGNDKFTENAVKELARQSVITVGETDAFEEAGGLIRFIIKSKYVRFKINAKQAKLSGVTFSSQLLSLSYEDDNEEK